MPVGSDSAARSPVSVSAAQMKLVLDVSRLLTVTTDLDLLLVRIAEAATQLMNCDRSSIFLHDPVRGELWSKVAIGAAEIRLPATQGIAGFCFTQATAVHVAKAYDDPRFDRSVDGRTGYVTRDVIAAPMLDVDRKPVGVIEVLNCNDGAGFTPTDVALVQLLADQAGVAVQRYGLQQSAVRSMALRREMELARTVQIGLLPQRPPTIEGLESVGYSHPASITGGDCYDLWRLRDGRLGFMLADAAGHGMAPALVVAQARALIRALSDIDPEPHKVLDRTNARLAADLTPVRFVTAMVGYLSSAGDLHWSSAGQGPILIRTSPSAPIERLDPPAPPLGVEPDFEPAPTQYAKLDAGGTVYAISDGIFEAPDPSGRRLNAAHVERMLSTDPAAPLEEIIGRLRSDVTRWQGHDSPADDQTVVVARRRADA